MAGEWKLGSAQPQASAVLAGGFRGSLEDEARWQEEPRHQLRSGNRWCVCGAGKSSVALSSSRCPVGRPWGELLLVGLSVSRVPWPGGLVSAFCTVVLLGQTAPEALWVTTESGLSVPALGLEFNHSPGNLAFHSWPPSVGLVPVAGLGPHGGCAEGSPCARVVVLRVFPVLGCVLTASRMVSPLSPARWCCLCPPAER